MEMKQILKISLLIIISMLVSASLAIAETNSESVVDTFNFKASADLRNLNYEESNIDIELDGFMYGISGEFIYHGISNMDNYIMAGIETEVLVGSLDYNGETWGGTPIEEDSDDFIIETRGLIGYDYLTDNENLITPFTGIGYRYWNNDIDGTGGYEREVQYWYAPIGITSMGSLAKNWTGGITAEYDLFLGGTVKSHLSDVDSSLNDPEVDQEALDGYGLRFSVHFTRQFEERGHSLSFEPYIRYWDIDESDEETLTVNGSPTGYYVLEPENETRSYGIRLSLSF